MSSYTTPPSTIEEALGNFIKIYSHQPISRMKSRYIDRIYQSNTGATVFDCTGVSCDGNSANLEARHCPFSSKSHKCLLPQVIDYDQVHRIIPDKYLDRYPELCI